MNILTSGSRGQFDFIVNKEAKTIEVKRAFAANLSLVWDAWTKAELLDKWWAPLPYINQTISMNFSNNGLWHYCMISPEKEKHYCMANYKEIYTHKWFSYTDAFCDEHANNTNFIPSTLWNNSFNQQNENQTLVHCILTYESLEALESIINMGFKEGFSMGLNQLDNLLISLSTNK